MGQQEFSTDQQSKGSSETDPALVAPVSADFGLTDNNTESINDSMTDLIDLNRTFRKEATNMVSQLDFITSLKIIPEFTDGNETDLGSFIARCDFLAWAACLRLSSSSFFLRNSWMKDVTVSQELLLSSMIMMMLTLTT
ncbi:hypothetical protein QTP88_010672 [Uroleucon formosanum]